MGHTRPSDADNAHVPSRSIFRPRNLALATLAAFVCGVVWLALAAVSMARAKPGNAINYARLMEQLSEKHLPAGGIDAIPLVQSLTQSRRALEGNNTPGRVDNLVYYDTAAGYVIEGTSIDVERQKVEEVLAKYPDSPMPAQWDQVVKATRYQRPWTSSPLIAVLLPDLGEMRALGRMNSARMFLAAERGDHNELVRAYEQTLALSHLLTQDPVIISNLVAIAMRSRANKDLREILIDRRLPLDTLEQLAAAEARQRSNAPRSMMAQGEHLMFQDFVQRVHSDNGQGNGRLLFGAFASMTAQLGVNKPTVPKSSSWNILGVTFPSKREVLRRGGAHHELAAELMDTPRPMRDARKVMQLDRFIHTLGRTDVVLNELAPAYGKTLLSIDTDDCDTAGTRLMLAIELFRAKQGRLPAALSELTLGLSPDAATALITDPFTGKPFGYILLDAPERPRKAGLHGRDYVLYGLGLDGVDNSGRDFHPDHSLAALNSKDAAGTDYILNRTRKTDGE